MLQLDIPLFVAKLKEDLKQLSSLSYENRREHLYASSKPLLLSLFQECGRETESIVDSDTQLLTELLIEYLNYDDSISIDALMTLYKLNDLNPNLSSILEEKIDNLIDLSSDKAEKYKIFKIISQLFPFDAVLCSQFFTKKPNFVSLLTNEITLETNQLATLTSESIKNLNTLLVLLSNSCIEESSRAATASMHITLLIKCLSLPDEQVYLQSKCYAATTTIKLWRMIDSQILNNHLELLCLNNLFKIIINSVKNKLNTSIEGLSLLCTNVQIRKKARDDEVINDLFDLVGGKEHTTFGILSVLTLLSTSNRLFEIQQKSVVALKDSNSISKIDIFTNEKLSSSEQQDDVSQIKKLIKTLIERKIFTENIKHILKSLETSKGLLGQCLKLIYNVVFPDIDLSENSENELKDENYAKLYYGEIKQIVSLLTSYLIGTSQHMKYNHETFITYDDGFQQFTENDLEYRSIAIEALCGPTISNHVEEIYGKTDVEFALSPIPFILEILVQHDIDTGISLGVKQTPFSNLKSQIFSRFHVYYAFVALAALASLQIQHVETSVFTLGFDSIINALNSGDDKLQFSALQLLNEICDIPLCIAKFFNWEKESDDYYKNFTILAHLIQCTNYDSQCLALQFFFTVSRFEIVAEKLCKNELFCSNLNKIFQNQDSDDALIYYALLVLTNLFELKGEVYSDTFLQLFDESKVIIQNHQNSENPQIKEVAMKLVANFA